eukprot:TRINITY_DN19582_c0_g1_i1.p1 TRINITY_DN19582_c0_g1~~TRINITY_DN19582_c0_g1_i1.p1  ORF type:complete len:206 (-),score=35.53 TRINITY_DN19582_c0_g1_i1:27-644(-)
MLRDGGPHEKAQALAPGPYGLLFASFVPFMFDIPVSTRFTVFTVPFSDKTFIYLAGIQLLFSSWKQSLIPGISGLLAGFLYRSNFLFVRKLKFPDAFASIVDRLLGTLLAQSLGSAMSAARGPPRPPGAAQGLAASRAARGPRMAPSAPPPPSFGAPPSSESLALLEAMGFQREQALAALAQARNDVTLATNLLIEAQAGGVGIA